MREVPLNFEISALSQSLTKIQTISQFHKSSYLKSTLSRLHERARDDFLHVCPHDEDQMVRSSKKKYKQKVSSFHWCPGAGGWQCTAPASALPTRSTTTTRSRSWAASCSPSPPWSCPTCRTPCPWPYPSLAELSLLGKLKSSVCIEWNCALGCTEMHYGIKFSRTVVCFLGLFCPLPVVVVVERRQLICSFCCHWMGSGVNWKP